MENEENWSFDFFIFFQLLFLTGYIEYIGGNEFKIKRVQAIESYCE